MSRTTVNATSSSSRGMCARTLRSARPSSQSVRSTRYAHVRANGPVRRVRWRGDEPRAPNALHAPCARRSRARRWAHQLFVALGGQQHAAVTVGAVRDFIQCGDIPVPLGASSARAGVQLAFVHSPWARSSAAASPSPLPRESACDARGRATAPAPAAASESVRPRAPALPVAHGAGHENSSDAATEPGGTRNGCGCATAAHATGSARALLPVARRRSSADGSSFDQGRASADQGRASARASSSALERRSCASASDRAAQVARPTHAEKHAWGWDVAAADGGAEAPGSAGRLEGDEGKDTVHLTVFELFARWFTSESDVASLL